MLCHGTGHDESTRGPIKFNGDNDAGSRAPINKNHVLDQSMDYLKKFDQCRHIQVPEHHRV